MNISLMIKGITENGQVYVSQLKNSKKILDLLKRGSSSLRGFPRKATAIHPFCHCEPAEGGRGNLKRDCFAIARNDKGEVSLLAWI
jgi:hypothetical protein